MHAAQFIDMLAADIFPTFHAVRLSRTAMAMKPGKLLKEAGEDTIFDKLEPVGPKIHRVPAVPTATPQRFIIRFTLRSGARVGPGKVALLEAIDRHGSIAAAGREFAMSYRRAWSLVDELNRGAGVLLVETSTGGKGGGQTRLTAAGQAVIDAYRTTEARVETTCRDVIETLDNTLDPG